MPMDEPEGAAAHGLDLLGDVAWQGTPLPGERVHALLATLVLHAPRPVSTHGLIDAVWGDDVPANPAKALQVLVSRTRTATSADLVVRTEGGYALGEVEVDAGQLARATDSAAAAWRTGDPRRTVQATAPFTTLSIADDQDGPLGEVRRDARRQLDRLRTLHGLALSAVGEHAAALEWLEPASSVAPDDEAVIAALVRSEAEVRGTSAALTTYAAHQADLRERTGADPGPELQQLHRELLARDQPVREGLRFGPTRLIGRDGEVEAIVGELASSRVVSIVGAGGLGKTTLAHEVGHRASQPVVHFVELAAVTDPAAVLPEIAAALSVRDSNVNARPQSAEARDLTGRLVAHLDGAPSLLILDNCEQVVDAVADLGAVLVSRSRDLRVLATSRAPLNIAAERVHLLPALTDEAGVELFIERAAAARPGLEIDDALVTSLVRRLDGVPLAIELAAARVRAMSVAEIDRRLADRFALLSGGRRDAPERHRTLLSVIDWSWQLLGEVERSALRRLSVFHDGFSLDAASAVLGVDDAWDLLVSLVDQSLLSVVDVPDRGTLRYRMLETVREFGRRELERLDEVESAEAELVSWARATCRKVGSGLFGPDQIEVVDALSVEEANLTAVLRTALAREDAATTAVLMSTLTGFWVVCGSNLQVLAVAEQVERLLPGYEPPDELVDLTGWALIGCAMHALLLAPSSEQQAMAALLRLRPTIGDTRLRAFIDVLEHFLAGRHAATRRSLPGASSVAGLLASDDPDVVFLASVLGSHLAENEGDATGAVVHLRRSLDLCRDDDGPWMKANLHAQMANLQAQQGLHREAAGHALVALPVLERLGSVDTEMMVAVLTLADLAQGDLDAAVARIGDLERHPHPGQDWPGGSVVGNVRAEVALARGDIDAGLAGYAETITMLRQWQPPGVVVLPEFEPWLLYPEAVRVAAHVVHGRAAEARPLRNDLVTRLMPVLRGDYDFMDFPIAGTMLFAVGLWESVAGEHGVRVAAEIVALGRGFGYSQTMPSVAWSHAEALIDPGLLAEALAATEGHDVEELRDRALALVAEL